MATAEVITLEPTRPAGIGPERRRWLADTLSLLLECGEVEKAAALCQGIANGTAAAARAWQASPKQFQRFHALLLSSSNSGRVEPPRHMSEWELRAYISAALATGHFSTPVWLAFVENAEAEARVYGPIGGSAMFDAVLARCGICLAAEDLLGAMDTVDWALARKEICLVPYYARLCFLRWGLLRLAGRGGSRALAEQIKAASCASQDEKDLARACRSGLTDMDGVSYRASSPAERFWLTWLRMTIATGAKNNERIKLEDMVPNDETLPRAERFLAKGLAAWIVAVSAEEPKRK